ncbi:hypothetical protein M378DRAFT_850290 [Amanita muscaria Koide BX008]|uniref:Uncharacterized protein n=1 Tax=Amanita muscaria (strain Koide BX008) TaxID=946122 RepID=A0A0C2T4W6_AMAMK|nr:hypothetical protein M378DRAFT_850290 [Amanita muscaria Koide BX008]
MNQSTHAPGRTCHIAPPPQQFCNRDRLQTRYGYPLPFQYSRSHIQHQGPARCPQLLPSWRGSRRHHTAHLPVGRWAELLKLHKGV